eukprot:TRINITY_DN8376_c0_g1_i1.p1 TRINITY_DN8376_c0_g1~~TRINITY_DN8376_c0_g1_i1.p1  ORF type:complete len:930 (+),score=157.90 TRINITY_DN8376_c0_g1_i1:46-2835(+)
MSKSYTFKGQWKGKSSGGCLNNSSWRYNPQIFLHINEQTHLSIKLIQNAEDTSYIGFYIAQSDGSGRRQLALPRARLIAKANFENKPEITYDLQLPPKDVPYFVVPCTFNPGVESEFTMTFNTSKPITLEPLKPTTEWKHVAVAGRWSGKSAAGCKNNPGCPRNPQYLIQVNQKTVTHLLLTQEDNKDFDHIGFYVQRTNSEYQKLIKIAPRDLVGKSEFATNKEAYMMLTLDPEKHGRNFVVLPCTFDPGWEAKFQLTILTDVPVKVKKLQEAKGLKIDSKWKRTSAGGCVNHRTWRNNPQFFVYVTKDVTATVALKQHQGSTQKRYSIGFYVATCDGNKKIVLQPSDLIGKGSFETREVVSAAIEFKESPNPYAIIPCTFFPGEEAKFSISLSPTGTSVPADFKFTKCINNWTQAKIKSAWAGPTAGGCRNHPNTWLLNPQFSLSLKADSKIVLVLAQEKLDKSIGYYVMPGTGELLTDITKVTKIVHKSVFNNSEDVSSEFTLAAGDYVILPCAFTAGDEGAFELEIFSDSGEFDIQALLPGAQAKIEMGTTKPASPSPETVEGEKSSEKKDRHHRSDRERRSERKKRKKHRHKSRECATKPSRSSKTDTPKKNSSKNATPVAATPPSPSATATPTQTATTPVPSLPNPTPQSYIWEINVNEIEIEEKIGQGGFGVVYKGNWRGTAVAIKKLIHDEMEEADYVEFVKEIEIMSKLRHPNCVLFLGACLDRKQMCIVTEFLEKGNMAQVLKSEKLKWRTKLRMARQAAQGMAYLHQSNPPIVHRDLKSLNLLVDENYNVKVADFGLSKASVTGTTLNSKVGSLNWCAPEILLRSRPYTDKADVYSFGMVLWELVMHKAPFADMHPLQIVRAIDQGKLPDVPDDLCPDPDYAQLIRDCWASDPDDRPAFGAILERLKVIESKYKKVDK